MSGPPCWTYSLMSHRHGMRPSEAGLGRTMPSRRKPNGRHVPQKLPTKRYFSDARKTPGERCGISYRRHVHRQPCPIDGRRAKGRQDDGLRLATQPGQSRHELPQARQGQGQEFLVSAREQRHPTDRAQKRYSLLLCYVDHHDKAYDWAEWRKLETHPKTGAAQLVEIRETVKEVVVPLYVQAENVPTPNAFAEANILFARVSDNELLGYGVPAEWLDDVKKATEDTLLILTDHLPAEAAE